MIFQEFRRFERRAADVTGNHSVWVCAVHKDIVTFGRTKTCKSARTLEALSSFTHPGNSHVLRGHGHWTCKIVSLLKVVLSSSKVYDSNNNTTETFQVCIKWKAIFILRSKVLLLGKLHVFHHALVDSVVGS